ncbi:MAG: hypothetical protein DDT19_00199 [Syntrophomonadaceae bacterium]|nr:hypothetical protein [Bacillota bacterium]
MNPNEIFTYPVENKLEEARKAVKEYYCRFLEGKCNKQSRTINYPMGVCSVNHSRTKPIICPHRFLENNLVFKNACNVAFGDTNNVLLFSEIKLSNVGSFDFVLVKYKPISSEVDDFCIVEFQSDSTTGTGQLVQALKDFMSGVDVLKRKYSFGMNTYNTIKLSYIQMLMKGQIFEKWNKKIFWVMQKFVFDNMVNRFRLNNLHYNENNKIHCHIYNLSEANGLYSLELIDKKSTTIANLLKAFTHQPTPSLDNFVKVLERKIHLKLGLVLE